jgi:hypothetical protein
LKPYCLAWYEGYGEKCILQPLSRADKATQEVLPNKNMGKIRGILSTSLPGSTTSQIWLAEREQLGSNLLRVAHSSRGYLKVLTTSTFALGQGYGFTIAANNLTMTAASARSCSKTSNASWLANTAVNYPQGLRLFASAAPGCLPAIKIAVRADGRACRPIPRGVGTPPIRPTCLQASSAGPASQNQGRPRRPRLVNQLGRFHNQGLRQTALRIATDRSC